MPTITRRCTYGSTRSIHRARRKKKKKKVQESRGPSYLIAHCQLISFLAIHFPFHTRPTIPLPSASPATVASRRVCAANISISFYGFQGRTKQDESREPRQRPRQQKPRRATVPDTTTTFSNMATVTTTRTLPGGSQKMETVSGAPVQLLQSRETGEVDPRPKPGERPAVAKSWAHFVAGG